MPAPPKSQAATTNASPPPMWKVHGALILTQCIFGGGAIVGKFGISNFNPVLFALIRECSAGPILLAIAYITQRNSFFIKKKDILTFGVAGFCLFSNQLGFITGVKLASAVIGSAWQPSQPLFLASISVLLGWERATVLKIGGILLAFVGAAFMVVTSRTEFGVIDIGLGDQTLSGNCLFFFNCLGTALFVIFARKLLESYPSAVVTGWAYMFACVQMVVAATFINQVPGGLEFVCPPEDDDAADASPSCKAWEVPTNLSTILPLAYWILFNSVAAYLLMTWGNQYAPPSAVLGYTALQPLTSSLLTVVIISFGYSDLDKPGYNLIGGVFILIGLAMLIQDNKTAERIEKEEATKLNESLLDKA